MRKQCRPPLETKDLDNYISKFNFKHREIQTDWAIGNVYVNPIQNANNIIYQGDKLV